MATLAAALLLCGSLLAVFGFSRWRVRAGRQSPHKGGVGVQAPSRIPHPKPAPQADKWHASAGAMRPLLGAALCAVGLPVSYFLVYYGVPEATTYRGVAALFLTLNALPLIAVAYLAGVRGTRGSPSGYTHVLPWCMCESHSMVICSHMCVYKSMDE